MIEIHDACKRIKGVAILDHVSLMVPTGAVVGLAGVNGSGKTMLMRAVAGLIGLDTGFVAIDGKRLRRDIEFPPSIGLLIENPALLDARTGLENLHILASVAKSGTEQPAKMKSSASRLDGGSLEMPLVSHGGGSGRDEIHQMATETLRLVGLDPADKRKFRKYSLGMKQRLGLAAAIMGWPDVVLLDEPTNALDAEGVMLFEKVMCMLRQHGSTVLLASHDADLLERHVDMVCLIENGRVADARPGRGTTSECEQVAAAKGGGEGGAR